VPVKEIECDEPAESSVITSEPLRVPDAVGAKEMFSVQLPPALRDVPQAVVFWKSPLTAMLVRCSAAEPPFEIVTTLAAVLVFTVAVPKSREPDESDSCGIPTTLKE
jgi:hypothetical protein